MKTFMKIFMKTSGQLALLLVAMLVLHNADSQAAVTAPIPGMVTMVDLGARSCIPCRMMAPILEELEQEYKGKAAIIFIDVWQDEDEAKRFAVSVIPTQIFYDRQGKEVYRHAGFLEKQAIIDQLEKLLKEQ